MSTVKSKGQTESRLITYLQELFPYQPFSPANLKHPTKDFVVGFYVEFLSGIGVNKDVIYQVPPSMYEKFGDTYVMRKLTVALQEVFSKILFDEIAPFNILDLLQPTQGRTAAFFVQMCNFLYYSLEKLKIIDDHIDELEAEKLERENLRKKRDDLRHKLNEEANTRAQICDLQAKVENKQRELKELNEEVDAATKVVVEKEKVIETAEEQLNKCSKTLAEAQEELAKTEARIVRSPLSAKNQECQLKQKLTEVEQSIDSANEMLRRKSETSKKLKTFGTELDYRINLLNKIITEYKEISKTKERTEELRKSLARMREYQDELNAERQSVHEERARLLETHSGLSLRCETKRQEFEGRMAVMREDLRDLLEKSEREKSGLANEEVITSDEIARLVGLYMDLCAKFEKLYNALLHKEKFIADEAAKEVEEAIAKIKSND